MTKEPVMVSPELGKAIGTAITEELLAIMPQIIAAIKSPSAIEQGEIDAQEREIAEQQKERLAQGKQVLAEIEQKRALQLACSHEHKNGDGHCVHVVDRIPHGYVMCMVCHIRVRPAVVKEYEKFDPHAVYDTQLFNKLFGKVPSGEIFR